MRLLLVWLALAATAMAAPPRRIISTAPVITEFLYALGLGDRVVGVTTYCHYPEDAKKKPKVGTYVQQNLEVMLSLKPDLVVMLSRPGPTESTFRAAKLELLVLTEGDLAHVFENIRILAKATGVPEAGEKLSARIHQGLDEVAKSVAGRKTRSMIFVVGRNPGALTGIYVVGRGSYLNDLIKLAGGVNLFADTVSTYPQISMEQVLARQPDVILDMGDMAQTTGVTEEHKQKVRALYRQYPSLKSTVHAVAADLFVVPGPRVVEAAREFARMLQ